MASSFQDRNRSGNFNMPDTRTNFRFDSNYLKGGYFLDAQCEQMRPGILDTIAFDIAKVFYNLRLNSSQLRRFFNQLRIIEQSIGKYRSFESATQDLLALKSAARYQVGRGLVREEFMQFIERNVELAVQSECSLKRGFIPHFAAVLGYFVYISRERV
ncbi:MAG: type III-A CRISPR-associated protein Csm2 [Chloroflexi bacterium]|nr:type III-A CRISPR-associated protein Csm2 [Chloroflexota bacterium]